jgi:hypothetical protein
MVFVVAKGCMRLVKFNKHYVSFEVLMNSALGLVYI